MGNFFKVTDNYISGVLQNLTRRMKGAHATDIDIQNQNDNLSAYKGKFFEFQETAFPDDL